jgi:hypothetical protein
MHKWIVPLSLALALPAAAEPEATISRQARIEGKNEISAQMGYQASLGATTPAGVKLFFEYGRKLTDLVWLDIALNPTFSPGTNRAICADRNGTPYDCGSALYGDGYAIDALAGIKLKFPVPRVPSLLPYARINVGVVAIFDRPVHDDGAALVLHTGGGVKYFVTPHIGLGGEFNFSLGPGFYSETCQGCNNAHTELFRAIDFALGVEFIL